MKSIFYRTLKKLSLTSLFLVCIHLYTCPLQAQTRVKTVLSGTVVDEQGKPIVDAFIYIKRSPYATFSNKKGEYQINIKPGKYDLFCTKAGFVKAASGCKHQQRRSPYQGFWAKSRPTHQDRGGLCTWQKHRATGAGNTIQCGSPGCP